ncbi:imidazolonepropionase [Nitriliruptor alkaliphilus]|uniref:imidazolonepropionase n=1 Tax=Nitriliruptor alkaliphilus TaxID=427918 RepID=UPI00069769A2|nr:imidazolonepropionase [Nitriliruptor alkaliphilus]
MTSTLFDDIGELVTGDPSVGEGPLGVRRDAALVVEDGEVAWVGDAGHAPVADHRVDVDHAAVLPGFVDSHAHLIFAGDRRADFLARVEGRGYEAGGIRTTVAATRAASDESLLRRASSLVDELHAQGVTTFETKSGYGLTVEHEARSLGVARELTDETTYLGAHVVPEEFTDDVDGYVELVVGDMLTACAPLARWIDVFVEDGAFDADRARTILAAGAAAGLAPRVHANQLGHGPGVQLGCEVGAASVDHCTFLSDEDVDALAGSGTVATLLPGVDFSTRMPYPDARRLLDAGVTVALATDCNPGSSFTTSLPFCIALAVREYGMTPTEAVAAATLGGAAALRRSDVGRLTVGSRADLNVLEGSHIDLAYRPGVPLIRGTWIGGRRWTATTRPVLRG